MDNFILDSGPDGTREAGRMIKYLNLAVLLFLVVFTILQFPYGGDTGNIDWLADGGPMNLFMAITMDVLFLSLQPLAFIPGREYQAAWAVFCILLFFPSSKVVFKSAGAPVVKGSMAKSAEMMESKMAPVVSFLAAQKKKLGGYPSILPKDTPLPDGLPPYAHLSYSGWRNTYELMFTFDNKGYIADYRLFRKPDNASWQWERFDR